MLGLLGYVTYGRNVPLLDTKGLIANQERDLILLTFGLGLVVVIPVFILLFTVAWRYRAGNTKARYDPEMSGHRGLEALWWGIPGVIILILGIITVISSHALDPYKPINSSVKPVKIQVVSLSWRWLFIYPEEGIATINYLTIPKNTPIDFTITSDAPMNSFWIPALAGQVYAMSGMSTQLHLMASRTGTFSGSSANMSGEGFASMRFRVSSINENDYKTWASNTRASKETSLLTDSTYENIAMPSRDSVARTFLLMDSGLYNKIIMKNMSTNNSNGKSVNASGMAM